MAEHRAVAAGPTLSDVGEFGLIARLASVIAARTAPTGDIGVGDDAAVIRLGKDPRVVATTDVLVDGRHFRRDWSSAYDIGRKAAAQNLADIEAMGARPVALLVGFAAPGSTPVRFAEDLMRGLVDEAAAAGAVVSGGDTVASDHLTISVTALGSLDGRRPVLRAGAQVGDVVYAAGLLGWSAAGLALLQRGERDLIERHAALVGAHRVPEPPYGYGARAAVVGATAMIDVSDGLLADLSHILEASGVGADLVAVGGMDAAVVAAAGDLGADPDSWCLNGGEDHALLFTLPRRVPAPSHPRLQLIGAIAVATGIRVDGVAISAAGYDHFHGNTDLAPLA